MGGSLAALLHLVMTSPDHLPCLHHHTPDRDLAGCIGGSSFFQRQGHPPVMVRSKKRSMHGKKGWEDKSKSPAPYAR